MLIKDEHPPHSAQPGAKLDYPVVRKAVSSHRDAIRLSKQEALSTSVELSPALRLFRKMNINLAPAICIKEGAPHRG
jgi:hypothetical protein